MSLLSISDLQTTDLTKCTEQVQALRHRYDKHLALMKDNGPVRAAGIHASEISKCYRQAVYTMRGEPKGFDQSNIENKAYWKRVLDHGTWLHDMIQTHFHDMANCSEQYITFQDEVKLAPGVQPLATRWNIHSSCDGVFTFHKRNQETWRFDPTLRMGLEIKSASSSSFAKRNAPLPEHIEQMHVYMAVLDIPLFWIMYFNKDTQEYTPPAAPWLVTFNPSLWHTLETRFEQWEHHLAEGTLPDAMPGTQCTFCPYKLSCNPPKQRIFVPRRTTALRGPTL